MLISYKGKSDIIEIPKYVTEIAATAFQQDDSLYLHRYVTSTGPRTLYSRLYGVHIDIRPSQLSPNKPIRSFRKLILHSGVKKIYYSSGFSDFETIQVPSIEAWLGIEFVKEKNSEPYFSFRLVAGTKAVTSYDFPEGTTAVKDFAFCGCSSLKYVTLPEGVKSVGKYAFSCCSNLSGIKLPEGVKSIESHAFAGCEILKDINFPESLRTIGLAAFNSCRRLRSVTLPSDIKTLPARSFCGCAALAELKLPEKLTKIGRWAFSSCNLLKSVTIPPGVKIIPAEAFKGCRNLKSVTLPEGLEAIGESAFCSCHRLESLKIPETVKHIGKYTFEFCKSLNSIELPDGVETVSDKMFFDCGNLTSCRLPASLKCIGEAAFKECRMLKAVELPDGVESIGRFAFGNCSRFTSVTLPENLKEIGDLAFDGCTGMTCLTIPKNTSFVGERLFKDAVYFVGRHFGEIPVCNKTLAAFNGFLMNYKKDGVPQDIVSSYADYIRILIYRSEFETIIGNESAIRFIAADLSAFSIEEAEIMTELFRKMNNVEMTATLLSYIGENLAPGSSADFLQLDTVPLSTALKEWRVDIACDDSAELIEYIGSNSTVICPAKIGDIGITGIGRGVFRYDKDVTAVIVEEGIKYINEYAFDYNRTIERIVLPDSITEIGEGTFRFCSELKSITVGEKTKVSPKAFRKKVSVIRRISAAPSE